jgi:hypothetical protein
VHQKSTWTHAILREPLVWPLVLLLVAISAAASGQWPWAVGSHARW